MITKEMGAALAVALGIMALVFVLVLPTARRTADLTGRVHQWFESVAQRHYDEAYADLAPAYREAVDERTLRQSLTANAYLRGFRSFTRTSSTLAGARAEIEGELITDAGQFAAAVHFVRVDGPGNDAWYVAEIIIGGSPILPRMEATGTGSADDGQF